MDKQRMIGVIFIDLKKAFDLVHHHCLLHKLEHHGIRGQIYGNLFANYLTARSQRKKYGKDLSSNFPLKDGVSQGSILGPLLLILYNYKPSTSVFIKIPYIDRIETLFHEGKSIIHKSYLTYGPRTILIFTGIRSIKDYDYLDMRKKKN